MKLLTNSDEILALPLSLGIPLEMWGKDQAKSVDQFVDEVLSGEASLEVRSGRLVRKITCAGIMIRYTCWSPNLKLVEAHQIYKKRGCKRTRNNFAGLSAISRFNPREIDARTAAQQILGERLGINARSYALDEDDPPVICKPMVPSLSYPGLYDENSIHVFLWNMPKEHFRVEGYVEEQQTYRTHFAWENL
ncbi:MAG TPA: hypothetical protein VGE35_03650 [Candidatus Paceibacterota bacterium]